MFNRIGMSTVQARLQALAGRLKRGVSEISGVTLYTPLDPEFSGGVVAFHLNGVDPDAAHQWLYEARGFASASSGVVGGGLRLSPHIYNSLE